MEDIRVAECSYSSKEQLSEEYEEYKTQLTIEVNTLDDYIELRKNKALSDITVETPQSSFKKFSAVVLLTAMFWGILFLWYKVFQFLFYIVKQLV